MSRGHEAKVALRPKFWLRPWSWPWNHGLGLGLGFQFSASAWLRSYRFGFVNTVKLLGPDVIVTFVVSTFDPGLGLGLKQLASASISALSFWP